MEALDSMVVISADAEMIGLRVGVDDGEFCQIVKDRSDSPAVDRHRLASP